MFNKSTVPVKALAIKKHLARMKVVMVLAPGALALKQTDKMEKPMMWIPPPTMYLGSHNIYIYFSNDVPETA